MPRYDKLKQTPEYQFLITLGYTTEHIRILTNSELLRGPIKQVMAGRKPHHEFIYSANSYLSAKRAGLFDEQNTRSLHTFGTNAAGVINRALNNRKNDVQRGIVRVVKTPRHLSVRVVVEETLLD